MRVRFAPKLLIVVGLACLVFAAEAGSGFSPTTAQVATPNFFDQRQRMTKPDLDGRSRVRFLTTTNYPPFNFLDQRGRLAGFNVDLVRAICEELDILPRCQIEAMAFRDLVPALKRRDGDAIVAGLSMTPDTRRDLAFTEPYFRYPARFVTRRDTPVTEPVADALAGKPVAVAEGSAHAAMLRAFFPQIDRRQFATRDEGLAALKKGEVAAYYGDGVGLSFWLESNAAEDCCSFSGGPFLSDRFLGEGLSIAVAPRDEELARAIDYAIGQLVENRRFSELLLRYFPVSAF
ncbi:transporter substrate-binding domain-containing protein [Aurantimonas sp. A2-1-M11]|uniref:transporter substrate-binding domain-containing protein n=1 Tax=Aurantimonas sp. A2-1-M11 TaxID=3113712 RepID=UPI002F95C5F5